MLNIFSDTNFLHFGVVICSLGIRYQSYCSNVIRSLMVNPTEEQSSNYLYLHDLFDWSISCIKHGMFIVFVNNIYMALS